MSDDLPPEMARMFYRPFCSEPEIDRIFSVSSVEDYLLKMRADAVADHMRIYRVMRRRMNNAGDKWNFTESFHHRLFPNYAALLQSRHNAFSKSVENIPPSGFIYATEPNGICMKTEFGNLITISESLKYALYFMNLSHLDFGIQVPADVRFSAEKIAVRIMLETESLDFDLDPRGNVPKRLHRRILKFTERQLQFVLAHEYAHHVAGHLESAAIIERPMLRACDSLKTERHKVYSYRQQQEFDADIGAISQPGFSGKELQDHLYAALTFLAFSDVFRSVVKQIFPPVPWKQTHPEPLDRFWRIYDSAASYFAMSKKDLEKMLDTLSAHKSALEEDVGFNIEGYETYGSVYLGSWRGPELIDRVDYYF